MNLILSSGLKPLNKGIANTSERSICRVDLGFIKLWPGYLGRMPEEDLDANTVCLSSEEKRKTEG